MTDSEKINEIKNILNSQSSAYFQIREIVQVLAEYDDEKEIIIGQLLNYSPITNLFAIMKDKGLHKIVESVEEGATLAHKKKNCEMHDCAVILKRPAYAPEEIKQINRDAKITKYLKKEK